MITSTWRDELERIADQLEEVARFKLDKDNPVDKEISKELFGKAWDLKQYARAGSPSEGI
jgi:hypothetical protein